MAHPVNGEALSSALLALAAEHRGEYVSHAEALRVVFKVSPNGQPIPRKVRAKLWTALRVLKRAGRLECRYGRFALAGTVAVAAAKPKRTTIRAAEAVRPTASAALAHTLNRFARLRNAYDQAFDDLLAEARHALRVSEPARGESGEPSGFPMRAASPWEREA